MDATLFGGTLGCRPNLLGALPQTPQGISSLDPSALRAGLRYCGFLAFLYGEKQRKGSVGLPPKPAWGAAPNPARIPSLDPSALRAGLRYCGFLAFLCGKKQRKGTLGCRPSLPGALHQTPQGIPSLDPFCASRRVARVCSKTPGGTRRDSPVHGSPLRLHRHRTCRRCFQSSQPSCVRIGPA